MRCLTADEVFEWFGPLGFSVSDEHHWYRRALVLRPDLAANQARLAVSPPENPRALPGFINCLNHWFPSGCGRLVWVDHWEFGNPDDSESFVLAARRGLGETRSLIEAPGHSFDRHPYEKWDVTEITPEHRDELGLLVGLVSMLIMTTSDGWLIAESCVDRIEFWEGNVLFHSKTPAKIEAARELCDNFGCSRMK